MGCDENGGAELFSELFDAMPQESVRLRKEHEADGAVLEQFRAAESSRLNIGSLSGLQHLGGS